MLLGRVDRFDHDIGGCGGQSGEYPTRVEPSNPLVAEELVPIEITRSELRGSRVSAIRYAQGRPDPVTLLGEVEPNARGATDLALQLTYWGNAWQPVSYTVEVNGETVGTIEVSGRDGEQFVTQTIKLPDTEAEVLHVTFRAMEGKQVPALYEVRLVRPE